MVLECPNCGAYVDAVCVAVYEDTEEASGTTGRYSFLRCPRCSRPFVTLQTDADGPGWDEPTRLYPPIDFGVSAAIPNNLRATYNEARACFKARAYSATAIMCRKTLEGIAEQHGVSARNLATALREMKDKGIIENRLYEWADALRISGNEAAHGVNSQVSLQDAKDELEFTNALLEYVFTFQEKFIEFKNRRSHTQRAGAPDA